MSSSSSSSSPRLSHNARRDDHVRLASRRIATEPSVIHVHVAYHSTRVRGASRSQLKTRRSLPGKRVIFCGTGDIRYMRRVCRNLLEIFPPSHRMRGWVGPFSPPAERKLRLRIVPGHGERSRPVVWTVGLRERTIADLRRTLRDTDRTGLQWERNETSVQQRGHGRKETEKMLGSVVEILLTTPLPGEMWLVEGGRLGAD
jgi:hypothetical protein